MRIVLEVPNIRHLRVFLEVVNSESISKASKKSFLSQPAITQAMSKLEKSLDATLFHRRSEGMYTTEAGDIFAYRVQRALNFIRSGLKDAIRVGSGRGNNQPASLLSMVSKTQLRALIAVTQAENFSIAGRNLGVSQSSVHRAARELEALLGITLFEKTSIGISGSKAALILARASKLAFSEIEQGSDEVNQLYNRGAGSLNIGSMPLAHASILPKVIIDFSQRSTSFNVNVNEGPYADLLYHLRHGDIDIMIGALRNPAPSIDIVQETLFSSAVEIVARIGHPLQKSKNIDAKILARFSWVIPRAGTPTRQIFESLFSEANVDIPVRRVESSSQVLVSSLLTASDRLTMISKHQIEKELDNQILTVIPYSHTQNRRPIGITMRKNWEPTAQQLSFVNLLRKNCIALR